jgi:subtilase family serine protease
VRIESVRRACAVASVIAVAAGTPVAVAAAKQQATNATQATHATQAVQATQQQVSALNGTLAFMRANYKALYKNYGTKISDVFDYGIDSLWPKGLDGAGTTVALVEAWGDPNIVSDAATFAKGMDLPAPQIQTIYPAGALPAKCPAQMNNETGTCDSWELEETIDVDMVHLIAPYAKILVAVTPPDTQEADDAASNSAPPEFMKALETISSEHLANVISISGGNGESSYASQEEITAQDPGELAAASAGIPVLVATGDSGVVQALPTLQGGSDTTTTPDIAAWSDSPWVTAVGGSVPDVSSTSPTKLGPDPLWPREGAGYSTVYARPSYQDGVSSAPTRSVPDLTMDADLGTSQAAPLLAGVLALATQQNEGDLGPINPALYGVLGPAGTRDGISDVVSGNNSATIFPPGSSQPVVVPGFAAGPGFDVASGWGTVYAPSFIPALVTASRASDQQAATRSQAQSQLTGLKHGIQLTRTTTGAYYLRAGGLLPGHPAQLAVDGKAVATLTVDPLGEVTSMIDPAQLKLGAGQHTVTLTSMLLTETGRF